jgi:hypothetical protein
MAQGIKPAEKVQTSHKPEICLGAWWGRDQLRLIADTASWWEFRFFTYTDLHECRVRAVCSAWLKGPSSDIGSRGQHEVWSVSHILSCYTLGASPLLHDSPAYSDLLAVQQKVPLPYLWSSVVQKQLCQQRALLKELLWRFHLLYKPFLEKLVYKLKTSRGATSTFQNCSCNNHSTRESKSLSG